MMFKKVLLLPCLLFFFISPAYAEQAPRLIPSDYLPRGGETLTLRAVGLPVGKLVALAAGTKNDFTDAKVVDYATVDSEGVVTFDRFIPQKLIGQKFFAQAYYKDGKALKRTTHTSFLIAPKDQDADFVVYSGDGPVVDGNGNVLVAKGECYKGRCIDAALGMARQGDFILLKPGFHRRFALKDKRFYADGPMTFIMGERATHRAVIVPDPDTGGSNNIMISCGSEERHNNVTFGNFKIIADDNAAIHNDTTHQEAEGDVYELKPGCDRSYKNLNFISIHIDGLDGVQTAKWGVRLYRLLNALFLNMKIENFGDGNEEHSFYISNPAGPVSIVASTLRFLSRTALQLTARISEGDKANGFFLFADNYIEDIGREACSSHGGPHAISLKGNNDGSFHLFDTIVRQGYNPRFCQGNTTGCFLSHAGGGSEGYRTNFVSLDGLVCDTKRDPNGDQKKELVRIAHADRFVMRNSEVYARSERDVSIDVRTENLGTVKVQKMTDNDVFGRMRIDSDYYYDLQTFIENLPR